MMNGCGLMRDRKDRHHWPLNIFSKSCHMGIIRFDDCRYGATRWTKKEKTGQPFLS
jgi:hypothetical protein